jgi:hypothetical protein
MRANVSGRHETGTLVRGMLADFGFATIFAFFFWLNARAERIDVSAEFSAKLPAAFVAARCDHRQRWPKNWRRERDSKSGGG